MPIPQKEFNEIWTKFTAQYPNWIDFNFEKLCREFVHFAMNEDLLHYGNSLISDEYRKYIESTEKKGKSPLEEFYERNGRV